MNNDSRRERALRALRALQAKTVENGCTEQEAMLAAEKAGQLMAEYHFTQSDLEIAAEPIDQRSVKRRQREKPVTEDFCLPGIRRYCGVKCWFSSEYEAGQMHRKLTLFGLRADTDLAEWLYRMIGTTVMSEAEKFKRQTSGEHHSIAARRQAVHAFRRGMVYRVNERLIEMAQALEPAAMTGSGTALVVVRGQAVQKAYDALNLRLTRSSGGQRVTDAGAYLSGRAAGDRVSLGRPVGSSTRALPKR